MSEAVQILQGDCRRVLPTLAAGSVHCIVTSPPYWGLRSYLKAGDPMKALEIGSEKTIEEHIAVLLDVFRECRRVLRDDGVLWVNYGDAYSGGGRGAFDVGSENHGNGGKVGIARLRSLTAKPGDLLGLPWRLALAMQADGWWLRQDNVWAKPAPMPESVNGWRWERCRVKVGAGPRAEGIKKEVSSGHAHGAHGPHDANDHGTFLSRAEWVDCPGCAKCEGNGGLVLA